MAETKKIVRILSTDIDGSIGLQRALRRVKGVSFMFSRNTCLSLGMDGKQPVGTFAEEDIKRVEAFIRNPDMPKWMLNRRKDYDTGKDIHVTMSDLDLKKREDINLLRRMRAYRGTRHELGLPSRGQRTRSSFRTQKTVGVTKKRAQQSSKPAAPAKK